MLTPSPVHSHTSLHRLLSYVFFAFIVRFHSEAVHVSLNQGQQQSGKPKEWEQKGTMKINCKKKKEKRRERDRELKKNAFQSGSFFYECDVILLN